MNELPSISSSSYLTTTHSLGDTVTGNRLMAGVNHDAWEDAVKGQKLIGRRVPAQDALAAALNPFIQENPPMSLRIVKVIIADPNENLPLDARILHKGEEITTDLTDQELFYEVDIKSILTTHNKLRTATPDKKASEKAGKTIYLEPARVRDLKMVVLLIAGF